MLRAGGDDGPGDRAVVIGPAAALVDQLQRVCQLGLPEHRAGLPGLAVVEEDRGDVGVLGEIPGARVENLHVARLQHIAIARQLDGRGHHLRASHGAVLLQRRIQTHHRAGHAHAQPGLGAASGHHVALRVLEQRRRRRQRRALAEIQEEVLAIGQMDGHEAAAADVAAARVHHRQRIAHRDGGIDGVATLLEDAQARFGGVVLCADHHRVFCQHRLRRHPLRAADAAGGAVQGRGRDRRRTGDGGGRGDRCRQRRCGGEQAGQQHRNRQTHGELLEQGGPLGGGSWGNMEGNRFPPAGQLTNCSRWSCRRHRSSASAGRPIRAGSSQVRTRHGAGPASADSSSS